ncbi:uncharacterized protein ACO6RY_08428 [Pungitius sinensis]
MAELLHRIWADFTTEKKKKERSSLCCNVPPKAVSSVMYFMCWAYAVCACVCISPCSVAGLGSLAEDWEMTDRLSLRPQTPQPSTCCWYRHPHTPCQLVSGGHHVHFGYCDAREFK